MKALENMFWEPDLETISKKALLELQEKRLRESINRVWRGSSFYRSRFKSLGLHPEDISCLKDLQKLPFSSKEDLRLNYPFGLFTVTMDQVVRLQASSGTTGDFTVVGYSQTDLDNWANCMARCLKMTGITSKDIFQVILGYGLFTGGLGFHYGVEKIGATVIPTSTGNTRRQVKIMKDFGVTAFTSTPSYALVVAETALKESISPQRDFKIKSISCGAETWTEQTRRKIQDIYGCSVFNSYGISELAGPGVAFECVNQNGLHIWADHYLLEIIDPNTGEQVEPNGRGEMVITTLMREAMPLIRYRTGDIVRLLDDGYCECGRTHPRISWILGRSDDMLKIRGVRLFPSQVEEVLMSMPDVGSNYQLIVSKSGYLDELTVRIEVTRELFKGDISILLSLKRRIENELRSVLGIRVNVDLAEPGSLPVSEGKAQRIIDARRE